MSAAQDPNQDAPGGSIFEGAKFWLSHRIPDRANIIALIKGNGGLVEAYDKRADILIADHARRDAPPNSFSWRLIIESDKAGRFVDKEPHRIGRPPTEPRPVSSQEPTKSRRVPYSSADDALLAAWVSRSTQKSGNKIYQELEAIHPHHTWHSWRDRWLKHLRLLPADVLDRMADASASSTQASATPASSAPNRRTPIAPATNGPRAQRQTTPPITRHSPPPQSPPQPLRPLSSGEREESPSFNDDDDVLLERYVKAMVEAGERWNSISIYEKLAKEHPRHSAKSWKLRFADLWRDNRVNTKNWNSTDGPAIHQPVSRSSAGSRTRERNGNLSPAEENGSPEQVIMASTQESQPEAAGPKETFYRNYAAWINVEAESGRTWEVVQWHRIQGRKFELWDLYEAVLGQRCPIDDVKWELVAEKMGFEATSMQHSSEELDGCWDKYLSKFHEDTSGFNFSEFDDPDNASASTEGGSDISGAEDISGGEDAPSPRRSHPSPSLSDRPHPGSSHRKRRLDRNVEISASPKAKVKPGSRHEPHSTTSSKRRRLSKIADKRRADTDTDGSEDIYSATPSHESSMPQEANHSSPLAVRPRGHHGSATSGSSTAGEHTRRGNTTPRSNTARERTRRANTTSWRNTRRERTGRANGTPIRTPSPYSAPKRRALPPAVAPEPEPYPLIDDNNTDEDNSEEVQATVEKLVRQGYSRRMAIEGLYRTSLVPALARTVLASLKRGDGVPADKEGVWTPRDDEKLRSVDAEYVNQPTENVTEEIKRQRLRKVLEDLMRKHGVGNVEARRRFLADAEEAGFTLP